MLEGFLELLFEGVLLNVVDNSYSDSLIDRIDSNKERIVDDSVLAEVETVIVDGYLEHAFHLVLHRIGPALHVLQEVVVECHSARILFLNVPISTRTLEIVLYDILINS